jgi:hypothetical protein
MLLSFLSHTLLFKPVSLDGFLYLEVASFQKISQISFVYKNLINDLKGDLTLQSVTQMCEMNRSAGNSLRHGWSILLNNFNYVEFSKPLYCFTLPGFILIAGGLHMSLNFVQVIYPGGSFDFESAVLMVLLILIGTCMAFTGILLHSIAGLIRYQTKFSINPKRK